MTAEPPTRNPGGSPPTPDPVAAQLALFVRPDQVTELRALHVGRRGRTFGGFFDSRHLRDRPRQALNLSREAAAVFFVPNPVNSSLLARRPNTCIEYHRGKVELSHDADVIERRYLHVGLDPLRIGTPDQNRPTSARELATTPRSAKTAIMPKLAGYGFRPPVVMCSGNGVHLVYRLTAPMPGGKCGPRDPLAKLLAALGTAYDCDAFRVELAAVLVEQAIKYAGTGMSGPLEDAAVRYGSEVFAIVRGPRWATNCGRSPRPRRPGPATRPDTAGGCHRRAVSHSATTFSSTWPTAATASDRPTVKGTDSPVGSPDHRTVRDRVVAAAAMVRGYAKMRPSTSHP